MDERTAIGLLEEYAERLRAGEKPDPRDYLKRYQGRGRDDFRIELNVITFFVIHGGQVRAELCGLTGRDKIRKAACKLRKARREQKA